MAIWSSSIDERRGKQEALSSDPQELTAVPVSTGAASEPAQTQYLNLKKPLRTKQLQQWNTIMPSKILHLRGCFIKRHCSPSITICSPYTSPWQGSTLAPGRCSLQPPSCAGIQPCRQAPSPVQRGRLSTAGKDRSQPSHSCQNPAGKTALHCPPCILQNFCHLHILCKIHHLKSQNATLVYGWNVCCLLSSARNKHDTDTLPHPSSHFIVIPQNDPVGMVSFPSSLG